MCGTCGFALQVYGSVVYTYVFGFVRFISLLFGVVVSSIGNITRDFFFDWIVFASVSYILRANHSPIVLKIRTRNFSLAASGIITETRSPLYRQGFNSLLCSLSRQDPLMLFAAPFPLGIKYRPGKSFSNNFKSRKLAFIFKKLY